MTIKNKFKPSPELIIRYEKYQKSYHEDFKNFLKKELPDEQEYIPSQKAKKIAWEYFSMYQKEIEDHFFSEME